MNSAEPKGERIDDWLVRDLDRELREPGASPLPGVDRLVEQVARALRNGRCPLLVGMPGVGKTAVVRELLRRHHHGDAQTVLGGRRAIQISLRRRLAALPRPEQMAEAFHGLVTLLCREEHDDLLVLIDELQLIERHDLEPIFEHLLLRCPGRVIAEGLPAPVRSLLEYQPSLHEHCVLLPCDEPSATRCCSLLRQHDPQGERFGNDAIDAAVEIGNRFLGRSHLPGKAVALLREAAADHDTMPIGAESVRDAFCRREHVPHELVDPCAAAPIAQTRARLAGQLQGQDDALDAVLRCITLLRAGLCDPRRPFGTFLFTGPTGVGKTHLAQLLAEELFGSRERLLRIDMAEHQSERDAALLFGNPDGYSPAQQRGVLANRLSALSFGVLLLDEFEKAHPEVHDSFLPVLDEGVYVNGAGEQIGCRSLVIIATSNLGAEAYDGRSVGFADEDGTGLADSALESRFRRELLNRFDEIVQFHPLTRAHIRAIAQHELRGLADRAGLAGRGLHLQIDESVLAHLVERGFDPAFGARYLRRSLEREVATVIASCILQQRPRPGAHILLRLAEGQLRAQCRPQQDYLATETLVIRR